ncbi:MAG: hypothetical protein R3C25_07335 [Hyphomonadaceae bacterium]
MQSQNIAANWVLAKRLVHWSAAVAVTVALLAPKPEHGDGLLHIAAGSAAAALILVRLCWRLFANVRPYFKDALRLKPPNLSIGARGWAPLLLQSARLGAFVLLIAVPAAAVLALAGLAQGEESVWLEAHEFAGKTILVLAVAHAAAVAGFALIMKYDLVTTTFAGRARAFLEGGPRALWGLLAGAVFAAAALSYVWGPFDVASRAAALAEHGEGRAHEADFSIDD